MGFSRRRTESYSGFKGIRWAAQGEWTVGAKAEAGGPGRGVAGFGGCG